MGMSKRQSHGYTRSYFGEFDSAPLLQWLNRKGRPANDPVEKLVRLARNLGDARALVLGRDHAEEIRATVSGTVRRFKVGVAPVVGSVTPGTWEVDWKLTGNKMPPLQGLALIRLLHTASHGLLDRIRECEWHECKKWFFARFSHQECCSAIHQQKRVRSTEQWKKQKREYMQRLRAEARQREKRQLELSKSKRRRSKR
jgi:hypothetical protein